MVSWQARVLNAYTRRYRKALSDRDYNPALARAARETAEGGSHERPRLEWIVKSSAESILYAAGGGFCFGASDKHRLMLKKLSNLTGMSTALLHYRLAPEHRFPTPVSDTAALLAQAFASEADGKFVVGGDSAGAMAVIGALIGNKELSERASAAFFFSPWTDLTVSGRSMFANAGADPLFGPAAILHKVFYYMGDQPVDLRAASPIAADLSMLPPTIVQVGSTEVMFDDASGLVKKAQADGVEAELKVWEQMPHVFQTNDFIPEAQQALAQVAAFVSGAIRGASQTRKSELRRASQ